MSQTLPGPGSRVAFYSRYSTKNQKYTSIEAQERVCEAFAREHAWIEEGRYSDAERSGSTTMGRKGLFKLMAAAEEGAFDVVLMEDIDRAARNAADMHRIAADLEELGIVLCTVVSGVLSDSDLAFKAMQNQAVLKQNAFKSKRGLANMVAGGRLAGSIPYGYRKVLKFDSAGEPINGLREKVPEQVAIVQRIHEDFDAGRTTFEICGALNAEGVPSPGGKLWRPGALLGNRQGRSGILRNPIYVGEPQFRKSEQKKRKGQRKTRFTALSERIITEHPELAILDRDLWDRNQQRLAESFDRPFYTRKKQSYLFTGKVFCASCGSSCTVSDGKYLCTGKVFKKIKCDNGRRVFREDLEKAILRRVRDYLFTAELLAPCLSAYREEAERALAEHKEAVKGAADQLQRIDERVKNLTVQLGDAQEVSYSTRILRAEIDQLGVERARLEHQLKSPPRSLDPSMDDGAILRRIEATVRDLQKALQADDREAARAIEVLRTLVDRIVIGPTPGTTADGRGAGDVTVTVDGQLAAAIDLADIQINRVTKDECRPTHMLDNATLPYEFTFVLKWRDPRAAALHADLVAIAKLLDEASCPLKTPIFVAALSDRTAPSDPQVEARVRNALLYLQSRDLIRYVNRRTSRGGYVWVNPNATEEELASDGIVQSGARMSRIRTSAPEATIIVSTGGGAAAPTKSSRARSSVGIEEI